MPTTTVAHGEVERVRVLGISCDFHDAAAALVVDGEVVAAVEEERLTRTKHDSSLPERAIASCLAIGGVGPDEIDHVVLHEKPLLSIARVVASRQRRGPSGVLPFARELPVLLRRNLMVGYRTESALRRLGGRRRPSIHFAEHHLSHAAAAYYASPFDHAAVLTIDGIGEWATASYGQGQGTRLDLLAEQRYPDSLGLLYSLATTYCGFQANDGEYKLMGLAPYGEPRYLDALREVVQTHPDGSLTVDDAAVGRWSGRPSSLRRLAKLLGGPPSELGSAPGQREADIARSVQELTEEVVLAMARHVHGETAERRLVMAGGVALNCVANGRLFREGPFDEVWVQPAAGDAGSAVGAALWLSHAELDVPRRELDGDAMAGSFLGPAADPDEVHRWLTDSGVPHERISDPDERGRQVAARLADGAYVGLVEGAMEFGPRALGHRSILADPRSASAQQDLNLKIKGREGFRPFAPAVLQERAADWFEIDGTSPYMLFTYDLAEGHRTGTLVDPTGGSELSAPDGVRSEIPACTHVDHSARVQTVGPERRDGIRRILEAFEDQTSCPVLLNTSFNVAGEPIVATPDDAFASARRAGLDVLVIEDSVIELAQVPKLVRPEPRSWPQCPEPEEPVVRDGLVATIGYTMVALFLVVYGPAVRAFSTHGPEARGRVAAILAVATLIQSRLSDRWWWARHLLILGAGVAVRSTAFNVSAVWAVVALELVDLVVWQRPLVPDTRGGRRIAVPGLVVLTLVAAWAAKQPGHEARVVLALFAMVVIGAMSALQAPVMERAIGWLQQTVGRVVSLVAGVALAVPLVLVPWVVHRLLRFDPLRPRRDVVSSWLARDRSDPNSRDLWRKDPVVERPPVRWRLQRTASAFVVTAAVALALLPVAIDRERAATEDPEAVAHRNTDPNAVPPALADASWYPDYQQDLSWLWQTGVAWDPLAPVRLRDVNTRYVNIEDGARRTWRPPSCDCTRIRVWMYGGSTTFGLGQRDLHTTASALARWAWKDGVALDIENRGVVGDTHWEEAQRFAWDLASLDKPDLVLFLDGINDAQAIDRMTIQTRQPMNFVKTDFWKNYLEHAQDVGMDGRWAPSAALNGPEGASVPKPKPFGFAAEEISGEIATRYERGRAISRTMAKGYHVPVAWFWQPSIDSRPAVEGEPPPAGREYANQLYQSALAQVGKPVIDLTDVLDQVKRPLYWDQYHTNELGASLIGRAMYEHLQSKLAAISKRGD